MRFYKNHPLVWFTVTSVPAIFIVPDRDVVGFTVTHNTIVPFPENESEPNTFIQRALLFA